MHPDQQISSRRSLRRRLRVPSSLSPVSREYPATSAARMAASSRDRPWPVSRRWLSPPENQQFASVTFLRPPRGVAFRAEHWTGSTSRRQKKRCFDIVDQEGAGTGVSARGDPRFKYRKRDVHSFAVQLQNHGPIILARDHDRGW